MMDPASARVALKLQLDDVEAILKTLPQSGKDDKSRNEFAAFLALRDELMRKWQEVSGRAFAYGILREENNNQVAFKRLLSEEQQAERDHDMACRLAGKPVPPRSTATNKRPTDGEDGASKRPKVTNDSPFLSKKPEHDLATKQSMAPHPPAAIKSKRPAEEQLTSEVFKMTVTKQNLASKQARVEDAPEDDDTSTPAQIVSYTWRKRFATVDPAVLREDDDGRTKRVKLDTPTVDRSAKSDCTVKSRASFAGVVSGSTHGVIGKSTCSSCFDEYDKHDMLTLACKDNGDPENHAYCRDCLQRLFESSVTDPSHFPPRCCNKIISLFSCTPFLTSTLITRFVARQEELGTPNRTYCSNLKCSKWIRPAHIIANEAACPACLEKTCATCKGKQHDGLCPEDEGVKELMSVARQKRWQSCPNCKEMVELDRGCYHITCRCRHEFCYQCLAKWKSCKCPLWEERNIINGGQQAAVHAPAAPVPRNNPVPAAAAPPAPPPQAAPFGRAAPAVGQAPAAVARGTATSENRERTRQALAARESRAAARLTQSAPALPARPAPVQELRTSHSSHQRRNRHRDSEQNHQYHHRHDFERYYRSEGWDTRCHHCGDEERYVNCCSDCGRKLCYYCTKRRFW